MAESFDQFDSLVQGTGYAPVPTPTTDAADTPALPSHCLDSRNDSPPVQSVSIATEIKDGPTNPAPYWNSGLPENATILP